MLFFFELFLFVLVLFTMAVGEFVSRGLALTLWLVVTAFALVGYLLARQSLRSIAAGRSGLPGVSSVGVAPGQPLKREAPPAEAGPTGPSPQPSTSDPAGTLDPARTLEDLDGPAYARQHDAALAAEAPTPLDERWARTLLYNWRRANVLLVIGALAVGGWYWLGG